MRNDFCQRQPDDVRADFDQLQAALRDGFTSPHQTFLRRQELNMRRQGSHEPLESYIEDIDARAQRLQLSDLETMQCFMQGLRQHLKEHVILQLPGSYAEATAAARLKNSLHASDTTSNQFAASATANLNSPPTFNNNTPVSHEDLHALQQQLQALQTQLGRRNPEPAFRQGNTRNSRTTDGRPICNLCNKVGHIASRCNGTTNRYNSPYSSRDNSRYPPNPNFRSNWSNFQRPPQPRNYPPAFQPRPNYQNNSQYRNNAAIQGSSRNFQNAALPAPPCPPPPPPLHVFLHANKCSNRNPLPQFRFAHYKPRNPLIPSPQEFEPNLCFRDSHYLTIK